MAQIELRDATVQARISQRQVIQCLILVVYGEIRQALAEGVIRRPVQAPSKPLPELKLQAVVTVPTAVIYIIQPPRDKGIEQEEIDRIRARRIGCGLDARAGAEAAAEHAADIVLIGRERRR